MPNSWTSWLLRQGVITVFLGGLAWFFGYYIIIPMQQDQKRYVDALIDTQKQYVSSFSALVSSHQDATTQLKDIARNQQDATAALREIKESQKEVVPILNQMMRDQQDGAWQRTPKRSGTGTPMSTRQANPEE